jgi:hypothetical protein
MQIEEIENQELKNTQKNILANVKNHIQKFKKSDVSLTYYLPHSESNGYALLKFWISPIKNFFFLLKVTLKEIYLLSFENKFKIQKKKILNNNKNIIITWGNNKNFNSKGDFFDKYYNTDAKKLKSTLWIVFKTDVDELPKLKDNILLLYQDNKKKFSFIKFIKIFTKVNYWKNLNFSYQNDNAKKIWKKIDPFFKSSVTNLYMPYEGQPFQNYIIEQSKKKNPRIKSCGYIHSFPLGLPANLMHRKNSPQKILINGSCQKDYLCKNLGWAKEKIFVVESLRFEKNKKMNSQIFLPYYIEDPIFIYNKLMELKNIGLYNNIFKSLKIKNHPETRDSLVHKKLIINLKKNVIKNNKFLESNNYSIFLGCSGAIIEALVRNVKVIHISSEPILEIYSNLWNFLNLSKIIENVYTYNIKKNINKKNVIKIDNKKKLLKKYF